jgi:CubicO group peptidase (beta-lactamase class C family)
MTTPKSLPARLLELSSALVVLLSVAIPAASDELARAVDPEWLGFSAARLARIAPWYQARFDAFPPSDGLVPGAVIAIAKDGKLAYLQAIGFQNRAKTIPMKTDSIFWIASMSKPVTSVAAMILVDEGKLDLDAPVARYVPEIGKMQVLAEKADPATGKIDYRLDPQKHPMTVRDLLRHTSGIAYPEVDFAFPERGLSDAATAEADRIRNLHVLYAWTDATEWHRDATLASFVSALARLPLAHQPGEVYEYGWSADVLGRVVEVASGQPLDKFLQSRIFGPLGMVDTGFYVPKEKLGRLVDSPVPTRPRVWEVTTPATLFSGGGGLVSTAADYLRFAQMLLNGGELDGGRVLSPQAVTAMTTNALPPGTRIYGGDDVGSRAGTTFGLGFAIRTDPVHGWVPGQPGSFSWAGHWSTYFWVDPAEKLIGIQMLQVASDSKARRALHVLPINRLVYGALAVAPPSSRPSPEAATRSPQALADYVGTYDLGGTVSSRDRQGVADGKNGYLGIASYVDIEQEGLRINHPDPGSPAARAGVAAGDLVTEVDGVPLKGRSLADVLAMLRGAAATTAELKIVRKGQGGASVIRVTRGPRRLTGVELRVAVEQGKLVAEATGAWPILEFERGKATRLVATSSDEFTVDDEDHTRIAFVRDAAGKVSGLVLNPGPWQQKAALIVEQR